MTNFFYPNVPHNSLGEFLPHFVRFLMDDHPQYDGPGWTLVEAYSTASTTREAPSNPSNLDSLSASVAWPSGNISVGDWVVLESANSNNSNHFQLYIEYDTATRINFMLIPFENFSVGGTPVTPPTMPATALGTTTGSTNFVQFTGFSGSMARHTVVATEGNLNLLVEQQVIADAHWFYVGELDSPRTGSSASPSDDRCYVIYDNPALVALTQTATVNRISPVDNTTALLSGFRLGYVIGASSDPFTEEDIVIPVAGRFPIVPTLVGFTDTGHGHIAGYMRNVYTTYVAVGLCGTFARRRYIYRNDASNLDPSPLVLAWDGSTKYP